MKEEVEKQYNRRLNLIIKSKLGAANEIIGINILSILIINNSFVVIN